MPVEDELALDHPVAHLRGWSLWARDRNSSSAWATTADNVRPRAAACARTRATNPTGSLTVNTVVAGGAATGPPRRPRARRTGGPDVARHPNRAASSRAASATGTPDVQQSAAALTRAAYSSPRSTTDPQP